jgi:hypothetical protein
MSTTTKVLQRLFAKNRSDHQYPLWQWTLEMAIGKGTDHLPSPTIEGRGQTHPLLTENGIEYVWWFSSSLL